MSKYMSEETMRMLIDDKGGNKNCIPKLFDILESIQCEGINTTSAYQDFYEYNNNLHQSYFHIGGSIEGDHNLFSRDGLILSTINYVNNKKMSHTIYNKDGSIISTIHFVNDIDKLSLAIHNNHYDNITNYRRHHNIVNGIYYLMSGSLVIQQSEVYNNHLLFLNLLVKINSITDIYRDYV